jgi:hypothetical protein
MLIKQLVNFCDTQYKRSARCPDCTNQCLGSCEKCLDAIHFSKTDRSYNCKNISNFYVCKYIFKYSSEIHHLLKNLKSLPKFNEYNIMSIGCGPCTELAGVIKYAKQDGHDIPVNYIGFDMNRIWTPIHVEIEKMFKVNCITGTVRFIYGDAYKIIRRMDTSNLGWRPNILLLQYVLSDLRKSKINVTSFLAELNEHVIPLMPKNSYIIINDINHFTVRPYFERLSDLVSNNYNTWIFKGHYKNNNKKAYEYGVCHKSNSLTSQIPPSILLKYSPWLFCSSAQMVIKKKEA